MSANNINNGFLTTSDMDFQSLKNSLKTFMSQQSIFQDYNFEGSSLSVLLDLLAYNTHLNALYVNFVGSESFLDSAQLRSSIVSHAKELDYTPRSRTSAMAFINIQAVGASLPASIVVPSNFQIIGKDSAGDVFYFTTDEPVALTAVNNWQASNVVFYEGRRITETFLANSTVRYYMKSANVDTTSIVVSVTNSTSDSNTSVWNFVSDISGLTSNSRVWFMQGYDEYQYEVVFGDGVLGTALIPGNVVTITYRETSGNTGNAFLTYSPYSGISGANVAITPVDATLSSYGGNDTESNTDIQFNAPRYYQTQGRAVSASDYISLVRSQFPQIIAATAYGGEDAIPQRQYGTVIVSAKIASTDFLPDSLKAQIITYLSTRTSLSISVQVDDPDVFNLIVNSNVTYSLNKLTGTPTELVAGVANTIDQFNSTNLEDFSKPLYMSQLTSAINATDPSIISNNTELTLYKPNVALSSTSPITIYFNNPLQYDSTTPFLYPQGYNAVVWSSTFGFSTSLGVQNATIRDNGLGSLMAVSAANTNNVLMQNIGTVDYTQGIVSIAAASYNASNNALNIFVKTATSDKQMLNSQILSILPADVTITLIESQ